jgi:pSer/pThr/pTyr-binding forkhead associated (FHA) protein
MLVVQFFKNEITVGRNSGCDVIITDISVSRTHCALIYKGHNLFLEDRGSKFGTLS